MSSTWWSFGDTEYSSIPWLLGLVMIKLVNRSRCVRIMVSSIGYTGIRCVYRLWRDMDEEWVGEFVVVVNLKKGGVDQSLFF